MPSGRYGTRSPSDRRFAARGFKRQTPVGRHIPDFVSFPLRVILDLVPEEESEPAARARAEKCAWLTERGYRVIAVRAADVEAGLADVLDAIDAAIRVLTHPI